MIENMMMPSTMSFSEKVRGTKAMVFVVVAVMGPGQST